MDPIPPDPYAALNVSRDASSTEIKTAYRKLALRCHPDKAPDKADEFHRIQQAYELIGDDASRRKYEDTVRFAELKQNIYNRRGGAPGPNVDIRTAAFDVRTNSQHGTAFQARGPARYEERRPPPPATANGPPPSYSTPRSPYTEDDKGDGYFPQRSTSRKYDGYEGTNKRPPPPKSQKSAPRSEETREAMRKQKTDSAKTRNEKKKQRDQEMDRERRGKFAEANFASVDSDDSEDDRATPTPPRRPSRQEEFNRKENIRSDDDLYDDPRSQKYHTQSSTVKEYINRAKVEAVPGERGSPPLANYPRRGSAQDIPIHSRSSDEQDSSQEQQQQQQQRRNGRDSRPAMVRSKPASRQKDKTPEPAAERRSSNKETRTKTNDRRTADPSHATAERHPPPLYPSASSPSSIKLPKPRSSDEYDPPRGAPPPRMDRSATMPTNPPQPRLDRSATMPINQPQPTTSRSGAPRKTDTTPAVSSKLRHHAETHDSGYSTGTSPNDTMQAQFPSSTKYQYGADTVQVDTEYESVLREPNRQRRSPSPIRDPQPRERPALARERSDRDRGAPPPSRSASYQNSPRNSVDPDPPRRRPSLSRNNSGRESSGRVPTVPSFQRGASMPMPPTSLRTGMPPDSSREPLFGEVTSSSPVDFRDPFFGAANSPNSPGVKRGFDNNKVNYAPRISSDDISYSYRSPPGPNGSSGAARQPERRGSEDISRQQHYRTYMPESNGRERRRPGVAVG